MDLEERTYKHLAVCPRTSVKVTQTKQSGIRVRKKGGIWGKHTFWAEGSKLSALRETASCTSENWGKTSENSFKDEDPPEQPHIA